MKLAIDSLFAIVVDELRVLDMQVLPSDTLRGAVPYVLGYPIGSARCIIDEREHMRVLEIDIDVTVPDQGAGYGAVLGIGRS